MADSVIDTEMVILEDNWPFDPSANKWAGPYTGGPAINSLAWQGQNVATTPTFTLGRKFHMRELGGTGKLAGWSTFIYLKLGTQNPDILLTCAAATNKCICVIEGTLAENSATAATQSYQVTNDAATTTMELLGLCAVATSAMTNGRYGWFWCGGVAPLTALTGLVGDCPTENTVVLGELAAAPTTIANTPVGFIVAAAGTRGCGVATIADD